MCWFHTDRQLSSSVLLCHYRLWVEIRSMIFSRILGSRASRRIVVASEDKCFPSKKHTHACAHTQTALLLPLPLLLLLIVTLYHTEYPFGQFKSSVLAISPPYLLPTSSLLAFCRVGHGDSCDAVPAHFSNSQNVKM